jgi:hypothetical protein
MTQSALLKSFFNALPLQATGGIEHRDLYVNRSSNNSYDPVASLQEYISWDESRDGNSFLFSGLRGSGKTTELTRLVNELNQTTDTYGFYCDASAYLNLNDPSLSLSELVLITLAGLSDAVKKTWGNNVLASTIWDRVKTKMNSNVTLAPKVTLAQGPVGFEAEISLQENPEFKKELLQFTRDSSEFMQEARKFAQELAQLIRQKTNKQKLVLVVDSLERLSAPSGEEGLLFNSWKNLFFANPDQLKFADFSIIYTAPPYLHAILPNVDVGFTKSFTLPNFKVLQKPTDAGSCLPNQEGIAQMLEIVSKRFAQWPNAIESTVLEHLAYMSGGNVRRFFDLIRTTAMKSALLQSPLPLSSKDDSAVTQAIAEAASPLQWLTAKDRKWLKYFRDHSANPSSGIEDLMMDLPSIIRLFDHSLVLNYRNGSVWYQVPPLVSEHALNPTH